MDWTAVNRYDLWDRRGSERSPALPGTDIDVPLGTPVSFCSDGGQSGAARGCVETVTGDQVDIPMTLELRESGRVRGQVVGADGTPLSAKLNASLVGQGYRVHQSFADANLRLAVPEPGTYVLTVTGPAVLQRTVVVGQGQDLDLGALRLVSGGGVLAATSSLTAVPAEVLPGGLAQLRAVVDLPTARAGTARLALPAGTTVPQDGVLVDGVVAPATVETGATGSTLVVPFASATSRTIRVYVTTPDRRRPDPAVPADRGHRLGQRAARDRDGPGRPADPGRAAVERRRHGRAERAGPTVRPRRRPSRATAWWPRRTPASADAGRPRPTSAAPGTTASGTGCPPGRPWARSRCSPR
jgi:hypothetical protein